MHHCIGSNTAHHRHKINEYKLRDVAEDGRERGEEKFVCGRKRRNEEDKIAPE